MAKENLYKYFLLQIIPVAIGVFLGFVVTEWNESRVEKISVQHHLNNIKKEIEFNLEKLIPSLAYHEKLYETILNEPEKAVLSLDLEYLSENAWKIAQSSELQTHLEYEQLVILSEIYDLQNVHTKHNNQAGAIMDFVSVFSGVMRAFSNELVDIERKNDPDKRKVKNSQNFYKWGWTGVLETMIYYEKTLIERYKAALEKI